MDLPQGMKNYIIKRIVDMEDYELIDLIFQILMESDKAGAESRKHYKAGK